MSEKEKDCTKNNLLFSGEKIKKKVTFNPITQIYKGGTRKKRKKRIRFKKSNRRVRKKRHTLKRHIS